jgi:hypothetical protein
LEITQHRVLNQFRPAKRLFAPLAIALYALDAFENVMDINPVVLHKGIAS